MMLLKKVNSKIYCKTTMAFGLADKGKATHDNSSQSTFDTDGPLRATAAAASIHSDFLPRRIFKSPPVAGEEATISFLAGEGFIFSHGRFGANESSLNCMREEGERGIEELIFFGCDFFFRVFLCDSSGGAGVRTEENQARFFFWELTPMVFALRIVPASYTSQIL